MVDGGLILSPINSSINIHMSSSISGYEDGDDEIGLFYPPFPPYLEPPSTRFLGGPPSSALAPPVQLFPQDLSLMFVDNYAQNNNPNPLVEDFLITHQRYQQAIELGQGQEQRREKEKGPTQASSTSLMMTMMKQKKMDHNAKERVRRLHLNSGYMALRSLLPDQSQKPKKKWSAPYLIDRAVNHIPQVEGEIEKLKSKKKDLLLELAKVHELNRAEEADKRDKILSVSINEVKKGQVVIQICHQRNEVDIFSELLDKLECQGMEVLDASVYDPCQDRFCHHIHLQMDESSLGAEYVADLNEKLVTWLS